MFDTTKEDLKEMLRRVGDGRLQLPDFQRDYVWGDEDVRSLIASIAQGFPVGALLTLGSGGAVRFKPRLLAGVSQQAVEPAELLLDGQQRLTSLYQSMMTQEPVRTRTARGMEIERYYYMDIKTAVEPGADFEQVIIGVPRDKIIRTDFGRTVVLDLSSREAEFEQDMFPLNQVFDCHDWIYPWREYWKSRGRDVLDLDKAFYRGVLEPIDDYKMPIIRLDKGNSREAICLVFEKVNVGGKKLDAFELLTAIFAADEFDLREDWNGSSSTPGRRKQMIGAPNRRDVLTKIASTDFLQACTLLHTRQVRLEKYDAGHRDKELPQVSCRRDSLLALPLSAYRQYADPVQAGFVEAGDFLNELKIIWFWDIPYPAQLVALASVFAILGRRDLTVKSKQQLEQWFWSVTLGEIYGSSTESRLARDVPELADWLKGVGGPPRSIDEAIFQVDRLRSLQSRRSAAYKGIHALLMKAGCQDFISGKPTDIMTFFQEQIDIHHIFPQKWCGDHGIPSSECNSIINKTPLSKYTNIVIGGDAPSVYLRRIEQKNDIQPDVLDNILRSHHIEPALLRADDFAGFFAARHEALSELVSSAMRKAVFTESGANEIELQPAADDAEGELEGLELAS